MKKSMLLFVLLFLCIMIYPSISGAISFEGAGGKVALVLPGSIWGNTIGFGAIGSLGSILPQMTALKAEVSAEYWGSSYDYLGISDYTESFSSISFNGTAKYYFTTGCMSPFSGGGVSPYVGGGLGLVFSRFSWTYNTLINLNNSNTNLDLGLHLVGGVDIPVGSNMKFVVEGKIASGGANSIQLAGGLVVKLK